MNVLGVGGMVLLRKSVHDLTAGRLLFSTRGAGPVNEKALAAHLTADVTDGVGDFAEYLHGM